ncbi:MAG: hypothetical protein M1816_002599 [Peltula sp. TS41687]|nr:MAG: hypothetical protein M1816_002599 [Peltula sp. TS41687]
MSSGQDQQQPPSGTSDGSTAEGTTRKRVCKACDRCRLKKSKCDGGSPCGRCKVDNAICVFGERKRTHDKVYPRGYVEMLEQQQGQLVVGLQELYSRMQKGEGWPGVPLSKDAVTGQPLTHDILERVGALKPEREGGPQRFEEDFNALQQQLYDKGAPPVLRHRSISSSSGADGARTRLDSISSRSHTFHEASDMQHAPPTPPPSGSIMAAPATVNTYFETSLTGGVENTTIDTLAESMEGEPWSATAFLDDGMDFLHRYQSPPSTERAERSTDPQPGGATLGPDWNDDEDFKALFNQVVV